MSKYDDSIKGAKDKLRIRGYYESLNFLMDWDLWHGLTISGRNYRNELQTFMMNKYVESMSDFESKALAEYFRDPSIEYKNDYDRAVGRLMTKAYDNFSTFPIEFQISMKNLCSTAQMAWIEARNKMDLNIFKPYLKEMFELKKKYAEYINPHKRSFDVLIGEADEGFDAESVAMLFTEIKEGIAILLKKIGSKTVEQVEDYSNLKFDKDKIKALGIGILESSGFNTDKCTFGEVIHPMTYLTGIKDVRVTVKYESAINTILTFMHEGGHARYDYGANDRAIECGLWGGKVGMAHESQAKFYENILGRSYEFWKCFYDRLQSCLDELKKVELNDFYRGINCVNPSLNRLKADEVTYNLHPIIRFEMEHDYFEGKLKIDDFKECWNAKYKEYIGLEPENDNEGILQDVHWAAGYVGYFQDYTLGNIFDGQLLASMLKDIPDMYVRMSRGDFAPINDWLYDKIHQYGLVYSLDELVVKSTGEKLSTKYYLDYLYKKYSKIYA